MAAGTGPSYLNMHGCEPEMAGLLEEFLPKDRPYY